MRNLMLSTVLAVSSVATLSLVACGGEATGTPTVPTVEIPEAGLPAMPSAPSVPAVVDAGAAMMKK